MHATPVLFVLKSYVPAHTRHLASGKVVRVRSFTNKRTRHADDDDKTLDMFSDTDTITTPRKELIDEHKHLVNVLNSPSHKDDKAEAKKQATELTEYAGKDDKLTAAAQRYHVEAEYRWDPYDALTERWYHAWDTEQDKEIREGGDNGPRRGFKTEHAALAFGVKEMKRRRREEKSSPVANKPTPKVTAVKRTP